VLNEGKGDGSTRTATSDTQRSPFQEQIQFSARRGAEWLYRMNPTKGRFVPGLVSALNKVMEGDHYLRQAGAAFALARSARFSGDQEYAARATQAILVLLDETVADPTDAEVRYTPLPSTAVSRLAAAGLLVAAIHELPAPQKDLLDKAEQLCQYIRKQQRPDGSLVDGDLGEPRPTDQERITTHPGMALHGLIRSHAARPAAWKLEAARKALGYYAAWWRKNRNMPFVPWQTAAWTEAYLLTKEKPFAEFVLEMNDWLCGLQYEHLDPQHPEWLGGFMSWADGKPQATPPTVSSALYAGSLAEACRITRDLADLPRHRRYTETLERGLQFLTTLQYTDGNTQHFNSWYRQVLLGGFHASPQEGDLRIDYTQHAVCAMIQYLTHVAR
jgi:hypothetical protein